MEELKQLFTSPFFWVVTVFIGLLLNVFAGYIKEVLDKIASRTSNSYRVSRERKKREYEQQIIDGVVSLLRAKKPEVKLLVLSTRIGFHDRAGRAYFIIQNIFLALIFVLIGVSSNFLGYVWILTYFLFSFWLGQRSLNYLDIRNQQMTILELYEEEVNREVSVDADSGLDVAASEDD